MNKHKLLLIEDEEKIRKFIRISLKAMEYALEEADNGEMGVRMAASLKPDLIICDLNMPGMDGLSAISKIREWSQVPIIVLSALAEDEDVVKALDIGADDYIAKPFSVDVLAARIRANLRKNFKAEEATTGTNGASLKCGPLEMDLMKHEVLKNGTPVNLSPKEYNLLRLFMENAGRMLTHEVLLEHVWGKAHLNDVHYLRVYIKQLREKIEDTPENPAIILNEPGIGYRMEKPNTAE